MHSDIVLHHYPDPQWRTSPDCGSSVHHLQYDEGLYCYFADSKYSLIFQETKYIIGNSVMIDNSRQSRSSSGRAYP